MRTVIMANRQMVHEKHGLSHPGRGSRSFICSLSNSFILNDFIEDLLCTGDMIRSFAPRELIGWREEPIFIRKIT